MCVCLLTPSRAQAKDHIYKYHLQTGFEWDSNIFKNFSQKKKGFLFRALLHHNIELANTDRFKAKIKYNSGGKIFFLEPEQNLMIHGLDIPMQWRYKNGFGLRLNTSVKYQNENNMTDPQNLDLNEDFLSVRERFDLQLIDTKKNKFSFQGHLGYFHFFPRTSFGFFDQHLAIDYRHQLHSKIWGGVSYAAGFEQFKRSKRKDHTHQWTAQLQAFFIPYISLKYHFELNRSSNPLFDSDGHRITFLLSHLFKGISQEDQEKGMFSVHFLATLLLKNFPSVTSETIEGERFLVTGAEDQNFNQLTLKLAYHLHQKWALEAKYSRFSNDLTSQNISFSRNLIYLGLRAKM